MHRVAGEGSIRGDDAHPLDTCLSDQHSIEGVPVVSWQVELRDRMLGFDCEMLNPSLGDARVEKLRQGKGQLELASRDLQRELPCSHDAPHDLVAVVV